MGLEREAGAQVVRPRFGRSDKNNLRRLLLLVPRLVPSADRRPAFQRVLAMRTATIRFRSMRGSAALAPHARAA